MVYDLDELMLYSMNIIDQEEFEKMNETDKLKLIEKDLQNASDTAKDNIGLVYYLINEF